MAFSVVMPALEMAQETGKLIAWRKKEGDRVAKGERVALPLAPRQGLHLVLTNPVELPIALAEGWPSVLELRDAIRRGDFEVLFQDEKGEEAIRLLQ